MPDYYLENPATLLGKPKATIADYVKRNGILVPRRFATLDDALASGVLIIARSEHPQDYDGASGLLQSPTIKPGHKINEEQVMGKILNGGINIKRYCELMGANESQFVSEVSASFWEKLPGANISLAADSSVSGRYHIFVFNKMGNEWRYVDFEYNPHKKSLPKRALMTLTGAVKLYETVRKLENFDENHCPIMELQYYKGNLFFLQYHRTRDFKESEFKLDRSPKTGEFEAIFTRGGTPSTGLTIETVVAYAPDVDKTIAWRLQDEEGSMDFHGNNVFAEIMTKSRILQIGHLKPDDASCPGHLTLSQILKPEIYIALDFDSFFDMVHIDEIRTMQKTAGQTGENMSISLQIVSDGRKSYVKRVD